MISTGETLRTMRERKPLVHQITNYVVMNETANATLAVPSGKYAVEVTRAEWELGQKSRRSPVPGLVYDTLYRSGEYVSAGRPVVSLLPP